MDKIHDLYTQLVTNVLMIDTNAEFIEKLEKEASDPDKLEKLYEKEFLLHMNNVGIHEDLINCIEKEPRTAENEFELAKIKKNASNLLRVTVVEV